MPPNESFQKNDHGNPLSRLESSVKGSQVGREAGAILE